MKLSIMNRTLRQKTSKELKDLNNTIHQLDLTQISIEHSDQQQKNANSSKGLENSLEQTVW